MMYYCTICVSIGTKPEVITRTHIVHLTGFGAMQPLISYLSTTCNQASVRKSGQYNDHTHGSILKRHNYVAQTLELRLFNIKPSINYIFLFTLTPNWLEYFEQKYGKLTKTCSVKMTISNVNNERTPATEVCIKYFIYHKFCLEWSQIRVHVPTWNIRIYSYKFIYIVCTIMY